MDKRKSCVYSRKNKKEYLTNRNIITKRHSDPIHWNRLFSAIDLSFHEKITTKKKIDRRRTYDCHAFHFVIY